MTDAEVLTIAKEHGGTAIVDNEVARRIAKVYRLSYAGTPYILVKAVSEEIVTKEKAKQAIKEMVYTGWRCSIETYAKIMENIEKLGKSSR